VIENIDMIGPENRQDRHRHDTMSMGSSIDTTTRTGIEMISNISIIENVSGIDYSPHYSPLFDGSHSRNRWVSSYNTLTPSSRSRTFMSIDSTATATIEPDSTSPSPSRTLEHSPRSD
jgi:hypothetical protein